MLKTGTWTMGDEVFGQRYTPAPLSIPVRWGTVWDLCIQCLGS